MANNTYTADYVRSVINKKREEKMDTSQPSHVFTAEYVQNVIDGKKQTEPLVKKGTPSSAGTKKATQTSQDLRPGLNDGALRRTTNNNKATEKTEPVWGDLRSFGKMVSDTVLGDEQGNNWLTTLVNPSSWEKNDRKPAFNMETETQDVEYTSEGMPFLVSKKQNKDLSKDTEALLKNFAYNLPGAKLAVGGVDRFVDPLLGTDFANAQGMKEEVQKLKEENKAASTVGALGGNLAGYYVGGQLVNSIPALSSLTGQASNTTANALTGGKLSAQAVQAGTKPLQNIIADSSVDVALDVLPNLTEMAKEGATGGEVAKQALGKTVENVALNTVGEAIPMVIDSLKSLDSGIGSKNSIEENIKKGNITRVNHAAENQPLHRTPKTEPALFASNNIVPTNPENVNVSGEDFLDEIAESTQKAKNIPKTRIAKDSKLSKMDKDISNLVKWYGDETAVADLEELRTAMIDFESTGSMDALNRIGELTAKLDDNFRGKTYTYQSKYKKNGALKSKGATYKYGDNVSVESVLEEALPAFDDIHQSKAASINMPQIVERVDNEIPYLRESVPADGKVREESHSMNIGKGRVNNVDEDVRNAFIDDPNLYTQLSNAETVAKAQQIYDSGNAQAEIYRMLDHKDPAAIPLGNKIVGDLIDEGRKDEAVELLRTMSTKLRESGQFSQAAAITMIKSDPETALRYVVRNIDDMNEAGKKKLGNKWKDFELTDAEMELFGNIKPGDAEAIKKAFESVGARLAKEYPVTTWEKIVELSKVGMLLNPRTNIRNIVSNWMLQPVRSLSDRVSALGQNAIHLINPDFKVTQSITGGGKQEKQLATEVWNSVKDSLLENTSRYEDVKGAVKDKQIFKGSVASKAFDRIFPGAIERANKAMGKNVDDSLLETARNFTYYLLEKGDEPFVKNNFVNRLASYMKAQGIKNIDEIPEDAIMLAKEEALKATFKDDNNFTNMLSSIKKNLGKGGEVIMPFTKTPANLAMRGIDYSPAGIVNSIKKLKNGSDVSKFMDDLSKNITGSAAIALGFYLTKNGIITGALSSDKDEAAFQKQQGKVAYSIKIGDNYYSYDWAQPAAIPIILGASIAQSIEESDNEEKTALEKIESVANIAQQATTSAADAWVELSPLQTISDIFNTSYGNSVPENVINEVLEFPQRFIPSSVGAAARTIDTTQRQTYSSGNPVRTQIDTAISKIPFLSKTLPAAYDTWGREVKRSDGTGEAAVAQMLSPGTLGNESATPIDGEIQRLYERTENAAVFPQKSKWTVDGNKLSNREYSNLQKEQGELSYDMAEALINGSSYNKLDDSIKAQTLADIYSLTKALAENSVVGKELSSTNKNLESLYTKQGADALVTYLKIGNTDGNGSGGALVKEDWENLLRQSDLTRLQKAYIFRMKYPKSENPFE